MIRLKEELDVEYKDHRCRHALRKMFLAGAKNLEAKKEWINELNVFPVPDGDTGTNMTLTIMSAAQEVAVPWRDPDMETLAKAISSGSLTRSQRKLRCYSFPASSWLYQEHQESMRRSMH